MHRSRQAAARPPARCSPARTPLPPPLQEIEGDVVRILGKWPADERGAAQPLEQELETAYGNGM